MQTMQQQRAHYALTQVQMVANDPKTSKKDKEEYKSYAASLPAMIHMNGLGQAAAFFLSKGKNHAKLYHLLSDWLIGEGQPYHGRQDLLDGIVHLKMEDYQLAQAEAQALMDWVKKFAAAYMTEE